MTKAFYTLLLLAIVVSGVMLYQENALLNSQEPFSPMTTLTPQQIDQKFTDADNLFVALKLIATIGLFIVAYVIAFQNKSPSGFYLVLTALYFVVFTVVDDFMFADRFFAFRKSHGLWEGGFSSVSIIGVVYCVVVSTYALISYLALRRLMNTRRVTRKSDTEKVSISSQSERP